MKSLLLSLSLIFFAHAAHSQQACSIQTLGGVDTWPWQYAQPFPWDNIQGVWRLSTDTSGVYFKMKITGQTNKGKILSITKFSTENCSKALASGVGFVGSQEKNIIRGVISDRTLRYRLTLGLFDTKQLTENNVACGDQVLAASMEVIGQRGQPTSISGAPVANEVQLMVLKKVSKSFETICKRPVAH